MQGYNRDDNNYHQGHRPLPSPAEPTQPLQGRRSLPKPPISSVSLKEDLPPSRSGRALPPVPGIPTPGGDNGQRRALPVSPQLVSNSRHHETPVVTISTAQASPVSVSSPRDRSYEQWARPDIHVSHLESDNHRYADDSHLSTIPIPAYPRPHDEIDGRGTPTQTTWLEDAHNRTSPDSQMLARGLETRPFPDSLLSAHSPITPIPAAPDAHRHDATHIHRESFTSSRSSIFDGPESSEKFSFPDAHPHRQASTRSSLRPSVISTSRQSTELSPSWGDQPQAPSAWVERKLQIHQSHRNEMYDDESMFRPESQYDDEEEWDEEEEAEVDENQFFNRALLSEMALQVKDKVNKSRHTKAGIAWVGSFTGRDIVVSTTPCLGSLPN